MIVVEIETTSFRGVLSSYSSGLTINSPKFNRSGGSDQFYYEAIQVTVRVDDTYSFRSISDVDAYGYLYLNNFNPSRPTENFIALDDDNGGSRQFLISARLTSTNIYVLVFTTYEPNVRTIFTISASGPARVNFARLDIVPNSTPLTQVTSETRHTSATRSQTTFSTTVCEYTLRNISDYRTPASAQKFLIL